MVFWGFAKSLKQQLSPTKKYFFSFTEVLSSNLLALLTLLSPCVCMCVIWRKALLEHPANAGGTTGTDIYFPQRLHTSVLRSKGLFRACKPKGEHWLTFPYQVKWQCLAHTPQEAVTCTSKLNKLSFQKPSYYYMDFCPNQNPYCSLMSPLLIACNFANGRVLCRKS